MTLAELFELYGLLNRLQAEEDLRDEELFKAVIVRRAVKRILRDHGIDVDDERGR